MAKTIEMPAAEIHRSYVLFQEDQKNNVEAHEGDPELRRIAKENGLSFIEVDRFKRLFDEVDVSRSGRIKSSEFETLLYRCGKLPRGLSVSRWMRNLWLRADSERNGSINFEEFVVFDQKYLATSRVPL